jgi:hypothetical protein
MSTDVAQAIFERVKDLLPDQQREVLDFVEKLQVPGEPVPKTIWEEIREIVEDVPDDVWERLPRDGSLNIDHYLYGAPKK